jgi:hypothetical protein
MLVAHDHVTLTDRDDGYHYQSGGLYRATMSKLSSGERVTYTISDGTSEVTNHFTVPPAPGASSAVLALIGDLGQTANSSATIDHILGRTGCVQWASHPPSQCRGGSFALAFRLPVLDTTLFFVVCAGSS